MHKFFAKTLFLGKKAIFLPECHSTNDELAYLIKNGEDQEGFVVYTDHQKSGRGQRGNIWLDDPGKDAIFSLLLRPDFLLPSEQFLLNIVISLGVLETVERYANKAKIAVKWPNDVLVDGKKICGILIENTMRGSKLEFSIVGIGFNLNKENLGQYNATSLSSETGELYNRDHFIEEMLLSIESYFLSLKNGGKSNLKNKYHEHLFRRFQHAQYRDERGEFEGTIMGVDEVGKLLVKKDDGIHAYGIKEIEFLNR